MAGKIAFYQQIVENMNEGVMALDTKGKVILFNDAAAQILGTPEADVVGKPFGQVFMMEMEDNDEFCQPVLDAVYNNAVGQADTVDFKRGDGEVKVVSMATSYLKALGEPSGEEAGDETDDGEYNGIVVVLNDLTEITRSREKEKALNHELSQAFIRMEETNRNLKGAMKKMKLIRFIILLAVILGLGGGGGGWLWSQGKLSAQWFKTDTPEARAAQPDMRRSEVRVRPLSKSISLSGTVAPLEEINVTAPFDGKIKEIYFTFDQAVEKGAPLLLMDTGKLEQELRNAKSAFIKARQQYNIKKGWKKSSEVSNARRALARAKTALDAAKRAQEESQTLFEKGIIARSELESAQSAYASQQMDYIAAQESLAGTLEQGNRENVDIAGMELDNARISMTEIQEKLKGALVRAPVSGIAIKPAQTGGAGGGKGASKEIEPGVTAAQGEMLLTVGNLDGLSVDTRVDEIDIGKIQYDQKVRVMGDAFRDLPMTGVVRHISSNAESTGREGPMFNVEVAVNTLTPDHRKKIRLGMSTNLEIVVYENPEAMVLPLSCVKLRGKSAVVRVPGETGAPEEKQVKAGMTTLDSVEILEGLSPGDPVFFYGGRS